MPFIKNVSEAEWAGIFYEVKKNEAESKQQFPRWGN
jgi:hypothetical protein